MENGTVVNWLIAWSKWKLSSGQVQGYPKSCSFTHLVVDNGRNLQYDYADYDGWCVEMNDAVESLSYEHNLIIRLEYISNVRELKLKLELLGGISKSTYYRRLTDAYVEIGKEIERKQNKFARCV